MIFRTRRAARLPLGEIIDAQAKHLADILLAEAPYRPFRYNH